MIKKKSSVKKHPKTTKKSRVNHKTAVRKPRITQTSSEVKVEKILVENFVALQKVMTNLSIKFDNLANQISKLLGLFEISAKALAKKDFDLEKGGKDDKRVIEKIDELLNQNKTIARGLTLIHEKIPGQEFYPSSFQEPPKEPLPGPGSKIIPKQGLEKGYQKSIISPESSLKEREQEREFPRL